MYKKELVFTLSLPFHKSTKKGKKSSDRESEQEIACHFLKDLKNSF